jgi:hypothetical protein
MSSVKEAGQSFVPKVAGRIVTQGAGGTMINMTVVTPDYNSFRRSETQIYQDAFRNGYRAQRRNS